MFVRFENGSADKMTPELSLDWTDCVRLTDGDLTTSDGEILARFFSEMWHVTEVAAKRWPVLAEYPEQPWTDIVIAQGGGTVHASAGTPTSRPPLWENVEAIDKEVVLFHLLEGEDATTKLKKKAIERELPVVADSLYCGEVAFERAYLILARRNGERGAVALNGWMDVRQLDREGVMEVLRISRRRYGESASKMDDAPLLRERYTRYTAAFDAAIACLARVGS